MSDVARLYIEREKGGRGLVSIEDTVHYESHVLKKQSKFEEKSRNRSPNFA